MTAQDVTLRRVVQYFLDQLPPALAGGSEDKDISALAASFG
jgi:hypothetical protein